VAPFDGFIALRLRGPAILSTKDKSSRVSMIVNSPSKQFVGESEFEQQRLKYDDALGKHDRSRRKCFLH